MLLKIVVEYKNEDIVYLKTDTDQIARMVYAIKYDIDQRVSYLLCYGENEPTEHSGKEISPIKNYAFESSLGKKERDEDDDDGEAVDEE